MSKIIEPKYKFVDLFAGCGGLSKGFMDAGFNIVLGVDNNEPALKTFAYNHKNAKTLNADLSKAETFKVIKEMIVRNKKYELEQDFKNET